MRPARRSGRPRGGPARAPAGAPARAPPAGGPAEARRSLDLGAYLSFSGIVTFKSSPENRAAAVLCPPDRLLVETDSPYLAPVPLRGRRNEPANVTVVGAAVAEARGVTTEDVAATTLSNTRVAFRLPQP